MTTISHAGRIGNDWYKSNIETGRQDIYYSKDSVSIDTCNPNYVWNSTRPQIGTMNISSGVVSFFSASTANIANLYVDGSVVLPDTITAHTIRVFEVFTSTIHGNSPVSINDIRVLSFRDGSNQFTAATPFSTSSVIVNSSTYEPKQFNISSASLSELNINNGVIKLANSNLEYSNGISYLSSDKLTYQYYDELNQTMKFYSNGVLFYTIEK